MKSGNYLGKYRVNFYLSRDARKMLHELSQMHGVSHTAIVELAVREKHRRDVKGKEWEGFEKPEKGNG